MAITTFTGDLSAQFAAGTSLEARPASNWPAAKRPPEAGTTPVGAAAATAASNSAGVLSLTELADRTEYYVSDAAGTRYVRVTTFPERQELMSNQANQANGYPKLDANGKVPWALLAGSSINVMDAAYRATGLGVTAEDAAFALAEGDAFAQGKSLFVPAGVYLFAASFTTRVPVIGEGPNRTIFTAAANTFDRIVVTGSKASTIALSADATANASTLTFANNAAVSMISPGDWLVLRSSVAWPGGSTGKTGETVRVEAKTGPFTANTANGSPNLANISDVTAVVPGAAVSGTGIPGGTTISTVDRGNRTAVMSANATATNTATAISTSNTLLGLEGPISETYATADSSTIEKLTPRVGIILAGFSIQGTAATGNYGGIAATYCQRLTIQNVEVHHLDNPGIQLNTCIDALVLNCWLHDLTDDLGNSRVGYGVNVSGACRDVQIAHCRMRNTRHSVTTNGSVNGVPHNIWVIACQASGAGALFDTHEEGRYIHFINCEVHDSNATSFKVRAPDTRIVNPMVAKSSAVCVDVFAARCQVSGGIIDSSNQAIRFESGAVDGRVWGTAMTNTGVGGGAGVRIDTGADRCIVQSISGRNLSEVVSINGGTGHHVKGVFADNATNAVRVAAGASAIVRDLDTVNCTTELNAAAGTVLNRGTAALVAGAATVNTTLVKAGSRISLTVQSLGTVAAPKPIAVTARVAGTSFTITSSDATDTSVVAWEIQAA